MIVVDASALVEIALQSEDGMGLQGLMLCGERVISCDLLRAEMASVMRKLTRLGSVERGLAGGYFERALAIVDEFYPLEDLQMEALRESIRLDHSMYDMFYFVLARRTGATLFTLDRNLIELCAANGVNSIGVIDDFDSPRWEND